MKTCVHARDAVNRHASVESAIHGRRWKVCAVGPSLIRLTNYRVPDAPVWCDDEERLTTCCDSQRDVNYQLPKWNVMTLYRLRCCYIGCGTNFVVKQRNIWQTSSLTKRWHTIKVVCNCRAHLICLQLMTRQGQSYTLPPATTTSQCNSYLWSGKMNLTPGVDVLGL